MLQQILTLVIDTVAVLYLLVILLRFLLQLAKADFYNPISQFVVKATNPLLLPLRKVIPGFGGIDLASLVLAVLFQALAVFLKQWVLGNLIVNPAVLFGASSVIVLGMILKIYFWAMIVMIISSWVAPGSGHPALMLINQICEPIMAPVRKLMPDMGGIDLSPIIVFLILQVFAVIVAHLMAFYGMPYSLI